MPSMVAARGTGMSRGKTSGTCSSSGAVGAVSVSGLVMVVAPVGIGSRGVVRGGAYGEWVGSDRLETGVWVMPMDVRPISTGGAAPGGRAVADDRLPLGTPPEAVRSGLDFAANRDGRWAPTWEAFQRELARMTDLLDDLVHAGIDRAPEHFTDREQFVQGVKMTAAWTLGTEAFPPLSGRTATAVSDAAVGQVLAQAERVIVVQPQIRWYAEGVRAWLRWITGEVPVGRVPAGLIEAAHSSAPQSRP